MISIKINVSETLKGLKQVIPNLAKAEINALAQLGYNILEQAEPEAPINEGTLIGSGYIQVGKRKVIQNPKKVKTGFTPPYPHNPDIKPLEVRVGYTVEYAGQLHDNPFNPGAKSYRKGLEWPGYGWLDRAANKSDRRKEYEELLKDELNR